MVTSIIHSSLTGLLHSYEGLDQAIQHSFNCHRNLRYCYSGIERSPKKLILGQPYLSKQCSPDQTAPNGAG